MVGVDGGMWPKPECGKSVNEVRDGTRHEASG